MIEKEAKARIKINKLLEEAGWRFTEEDGKPVNVSLEQNVKITDKISDDFGVNFEKTKSGFVDFTLLGTDGAPVCVLEAKSEKKDPLVGKEQARKYAQPLNVKYALLSNGNLHYFWEIEQGNPYLIDKFPTPESLGSRKTIKIDKEALVEETISEDYIAKTQKSDYKQYPDYIDEDRRQHFIEQNKLRFLRPYQVKAVQSLQHAISKGKERFLFEMATGTGKTLVAAAVIKLFLHTKNIKRVLFLVDRLELENQAQQNFIKYLSKEFTSVIFKENRDDWKKADIVVSTVQSFMRYDKYKHLFSPTDFDLVISDEAHRSINGNSRAVFEYFIGYKLGLTATPKDYLKNIDKLTLKQNIPLNLERREQRDTYKTFGCEDSEPTFKYSLTDGVKEGHLINPLVVDARTNITTELLSKEGYAVLVKTDEGEEKEKEFLPKHFEKLFFSESTNRIFCKVFMNKCIERSNFWRNWKNHLFLCQSNSCC